MVINDLTLPVVCRNIILLLILGTIPDEVFAAEIALHFWYSAFLPFEYRLRISTILNSMLSNDAATSEGFTTSHPLDLGPCSSLSYALPCAAGEYLLSYISSNFSLGDVQSEYDAVRKAPSRRDYRERMYTRLWPSHRVAFQEYYDFGIILPLGAVNSHFNSPNLSLFSPKGKWFQTDHANPLKGWK